MTVFKKYPGPGIAHVGSYQMAGIPFASSSIRVPATESAAISVEFPWVTKFVTVINENTGANAPLRVGFSQHGVENVSNIGSNAAPDANYHGRPAGNNYWFVLNNGESYTGEWRLGEIWFLGHNKFNGGAPGFTTASVIAGLTGIGLREVPAISGNLPAGMTETYDDLGGWSGSIGVG